MDKRVRASSSSDSKQKQMKGSTLIIGKNNKKKKKSRKRNLLYLEKVVSYLLSDSYMYNPLVSPQPTFHFPPPKLFLSPPGCEDDVALPVKGTNRKIEKVVDFFEADCYLYAPLLTNHHVSSNNHLVPPTSGHSETPEETRNTETRPALVMKSVAYHESVKHTIYQDGRSTKTSSGVLLD